MNRDILNPLNFKIMDKEFTMQLQEWLNTPADKRDLELGAKFLLQLSNNVVLYKNLTRNLPGHAQFIEFRLKRYLQFRLKDLTREEVSDMQMKVNNIVHQHHLDAEPEPAQTEAEQFRSGKRADHDTLPAEIQALYVENASLMQKMRELHLQLRHLSEQQSSCPDSDRYPFLKELVELDKRYHRNWLQYDQYNAVPTTEPVTAPEAEGADKEPEQAPCSDSDSEEQESELSSGSAAADNGAQGSLAEEEAARLEQKNILRKVNLAKGRYKKGPSEKGKESVLVLYRQLTAPADELTAELKELGIL